MKVAVTAEGDTLGSYVADDFGHAPYFLLVDTDSLDFTVVENEYARGDGAGYKVAQAITGLGVGAVLVGGIGTHGTKILNDAGIRVVADVDGTVEEVVTSFRDRLALEAKFKDRA
ncbi:MAG: NifB/NifX family molybdenum-iron cluster-binding protein [Candidatus Methanomethylophilus sp.]|nr:NifB/NifX family molybdenum-iron cluster-binding protein [Methanomethylophilus sp.]MDD3233426.1 NifB/NifX family molybdenum-iron cluster-binding protein [Methanomethylophilus sp.]MDD4221693.1 NifB/NifX family molybdenum-iron cluster-binding protein [Methanomethylophilus sp.]MDD4668265.1 NifB/NifX family molybdenum-iron cluster-binding protein [Methanomethylophilus sp.]